MALCDTCLRLTQQWLIPHSIDMYTGERGRVPEPLHWWHLPSWEELEVSAATCELCRLISSEAARPPKEDKFGYTDILAGEVKEEDARKLRFQVFGGGRIEIFCKERGIRWGLHLALEDESWERAPEPVQASFAVRPVSISPVDERNMNMVKSWLERCQAHHPRCSTWANRDNSGRHLPTRVIDVGRSGDEMVYLRVTQDDDQAQYIALSYCWGRPANPFITTRANIEQRRQGMRVDAMPQTYQDAIFLTRRLGIPFIWIDALCIIQRDPDDWKREAATMRKVYSRATITLAGHCASDTSSGLLINRTARHQAGVHIPWPLTSGPYAAVQPYRALIVPEFQGFKDALKQSPLSSRGWTFQERSLAARFLHLGAELVYWECRESYMAEDKRSDTNCVPFGLAHFNKVYEGSGMSNVLMHSAWQTSISQFSRRDLTVDGDKFPAFAGIARVYGEEGKLGTYLAGLWSDEFAKHLVWQVDRSGGVAHRRAQGYRAPTWSWAGIEGPIKNPAIERAFEWSSEGSRMLDELGYETRHTSVMISTTTTVERDDADEYGSVNSASIAARGTLTRALCKLTADASDSGGRSIEDPNSNAFPIGSGVLDVEVADESVEVWVAPILLCQKPMVKNLLQCEVLLLKDVSGRPGLAHSGKVMERLGKGRVLLLWLQAGRASPLDFTIV